MTRELRSSIVIGASSPAAIEKMKRLYAPFNRNHDRILHMDVRSAELTKYAANAMLATRISFMNELANLAETLDADIEHVRALLKSAFGAPNSLRQITMQAVARKGVGGEVDDRHHLRA